MTLPLIGRRLKALKDTFKFASRAERELIEYDRRHYGGAIEEWCHRQAAQQWAHEDRKQMLAKWGQRPRLGKP